MLGQLNLWGKNKVEVAIDRLQSFEPKEGYYLAFSGGKDSQCIYELAKMAGVKFNAFYRAQASTHRSWCGLSRSNTQMCISRFHEMPMASKSQCGH